MGSAKRRTDRAYFFAEIMTKILINLILAVFAISSLTEHKHRFFVDISTVATEQQPIIKEALGYYEDAVGCVEFTILSGELINKNKILYIFQVQELPNNKIGISMGDIQTILLAKRYGDKTPVSDDMLYKLVLHEVSHQLGMPSKPHPFSDFYSSHLAEKIAPETPKKLFDNDIKYLKELACK